MSLLVAVERVAGRQVRHFARSGPQAAAAAARHAGQRAVERVQVYVQVGVVGVGCAGEVDHRAAQGAASHRGATGRSMALRSGRRLVGPLLHLLQRGVKAKGAAWTGRARAENRRSMAALARLLPSRGVVACGFMDSRRRACRCCCVRPASAPDRSLPCWLGWKSGRRYSRQGRQDSPPGRRARRACVRRWSRCSMPQRAIAVQVVQTDGNSTA